MSGKDMLTLLLCAFGYDRNIKIETENVGYSEPRYIIHAENKDGDCYDRDDSEGLMFNIYEIISYMTNYDKYINGPSEKTRKFDLHNLHFETMWWNVPPKRILNENERNTMVKEKDERDRKLQEECDKLKPFFEWEKKNNPCNTCTEKVPLTSLPAGWHHDCEICYNQSCPKMRRFFDVEYKEEMEKYK